MSEIPLTKTPVVAEPVAPASDQPIVPVALEGVAPSAETFAPRVTWRAFVVGLVLSLGLAALNCWIETVANVHFLGGIQMPLGAIFAVLVLVLVVNGPLKWLGRRNFRSRALAPLTGAELLTVYVMTLFAALVSTVGTDNFFLTTGAGLFYFSTRSNGWAELFYAHIPSHFAPGWDGQTYQKSVIDPLYTGGLSAAQVPWHAWSAMLIGWGIFTLLLYGALFFTSLLLRRQWIENEALSFPLIQLPLQMVESSSGERPPSREFWGDKGMWMGVALASSFHLLRGLNNYFPDWPQIGAFQGNAFIMEITETPWNSMGGVGISFYFGAIGIAYLLTREMSFSFWFFFLLFKLQLVGATMAGFPAQSLPKDNYLGNPTFLTWQNVGAWMAMGLLLLWSARGHLTWMFRSAWKSQPANSRFQTREAQSAEPFHPRLVLVGWAVCVAGLLGWCAFSGINLMAALAFLALYGVTSIVLARLVVEGGFLFPQTVFAPLEVLTGSVMGTGAMGAATLTRLSFLQPMTFFDMRTNLLPGFLHTLKIAHESRFTARDTRRLMMFAGVAIVGAWGVAMFVAIASLYSVGGLAAYDWFAQSGPREAMNGSASMLSGGDGVRASHWGWMGLGAAIVVGLTLARARFLWFPLHPLGFLVAGGYPVKQLWFSFFLGWATKTLMLNFGGADAAQRLRPFMIGLILGNATAMVLWLIYGFFAGSQIAFWPA